jgi:hypothetical protein
MFHGDNPIHKYYLFKIVRPDLDDLEFMGGSYELNQSNINYFEKKLGRKFDLKKYVYDLALRYLHWLGGLSQQWWWFCLEY